MKGHRFGMLPPSCPRHFLRSWYSGLFLSGLMAILPVQAEVTFGSSSGTPLSLNVSSTASLSAAALPVSATTSILAIPQSSVSGTAPSPYTLTGGPLDDTAPTAGVNLGASAVGIDVNASVNTAAIRATALTASASSSVDGAAGSRTTTASAGLTGLDVGFGVISGTITPFPGSPTIVDTVALRFTTGVVGSDSGVTGAGPLDASFSRSVADFHLSLFGVSILSFAPGSLAADLEAGNPVNTVIDLGEVAITLPDGLTDLVATGLILVSNSGNTASGLLSGSASADALTVGFQNINIRAVIGGLITVETQVTGNVVAASTEALQIVPEPSGAVLATAALTFLALRRRRRNPL